jgi:predicted naringenin-chalcone synthase
MNMRLTSIANSVSEHSWTQEECWIALRDSAVMRGLKPRSIELLEKVLASNSGIEKRHFCTESLEPVFHRGAQELSETYEREAPALASHALMSAMEKADVKGVDALFVCTCTGQLCPGLSSHVAEASRLAKDVFLMDHTGAGCGAAIPTLRAAAHYLAAHPDHRVAVVAVEVCSAAFYVSDDPGVLISLCLFGDGAAAVILDARRDLSGWRFGGFSTVHVPDEREKIRFVNREGKLCNQLHRAVPEIAAAAVKGLFPNHGTRVDRVISHSGGRDVLTAIRAQLPGHPLVEAEEVLRTRGNVSSPAVLMALERALENPRDDCAWWLVSFGAGFSAHGTMLTRDY